MSQRIGLPVEQIVREQLKKAKAERRKRRSLGLAGKINGPADLSERKGFSPNDEGRASPVQPDKTLGLHSRLTS